jgi:hypothetical protein
MLILDTGRQSAKSRNEKPFRMNTLVLGFFNLTRKTNMEQVRDTQIKRGLKKY